MTVCIAAVCKHEGKTAIVLCCDWQGTKGDFIKSDSIDKIRWVSTASAMIAGAETNADEFLNECDKCIKEFTVKTDADRSDLDMQEYLAALRDAVAKRKKVLVKELLALTRTMEPDEFWDKGLTRLGPSEFSRSLEEIRELTLGCSVILASIGADGEDVMIRITPAGKVLWENTFVTIGSGGPIAEAFLHQYEWDADISLEECLYRVYSAKRAAEKSPHVGPTTSFEILIDQKRFDLTDDAFKEMKKKVQPSRSRYLRFSDNILEEIKDDDHG